MLGGGAVPRIEAYSAFPLETSEPTEPASLVSAQPGLPVAHRETVPCACSNWRRSNRDACYWNGIMFVSRPSSRLIRQDDWGARQLHAPAAPPFPPRMPVHHLVGADITTCCESDPRSGDSLLPTQSACAPRWRRDTRGGSRYRNPTSFVCTLSGAGVEGAPRGRGPTGSAQAVHLRYRPAWNSSAGLETMTNWP